jgi:hypothetical protein
MDPWYVPTSQSIWDESMDSSLVYAAIAVGSLQNDDVKLDVLIFLRAKAEIERQVMMMMMMMMIWIAGRTSEGSLGVPIEGIDIVVLLLVVVVVVVVVM